MGFTFVAVGSDVGVLARGAETLAARWTHHATHLQGR
jgi:2-keto-3-deoxy-L-rhamnonate aldolase RhmA